MKICIVGGVAGGAGAAAKLRRQDENAEIILFEKGEHISYANCGLPYYIGGEIKSRESLIVTKPELLRDRFRIDVRTQNQVLSIDRKNHKILVKCHQDGTEYEESYDKLILSPGAAPKRLPIKGSDQEGILTVRNVNDTLNIEAYMEKHSVHSAVVAGGGFIGVEMAENLRKRGLEVALVEYNAQIMAPLDIEMANILHKEMRDNGVKLYLNKGVQGFEKQQNGEIHVSLSSREILKAGIVILALGVVPESGLAKEAGLALGIGGSIAVNEYFQTSDPDIYAVGDAIMVQHGVTGEDTLLPLAGPANRQGRSVASNIAGKQETNGKKVLGSSVVKVFDCVAASTGLNEKQLKKAGIAYQKTYVHPQSHAGYYPGAKQMSLKMLFDQEGKILGAQAVGIEQVEKQIDVIATAMKFNATVYDLEELELCYAPPFNSAKSPVNMLGFTASNILKGVMPVFYAEEIAELDPEQSILLDVSTLDEVYMGTIPNSINIPVDELRDRLSELDREKEIYVFCRVGLRGNVAARLLLQKGYKVKNLSGGYKTYGMLHVKADKENLQVEQKRQVIECPYQGNIVEADACGLQCPGPIMKAAQHMKEMKNQDILRIKASDPAFASDIEAWCQSTGNTLLKIEKKSGIYQVEIRKGSDVTEDKVKAASTDLMSAGNDKTMVVFSGDLDKAIASFIIANGAAAMDRKVTMFFTFWGLNILRKNEKIKVKKDLMGSMFGRMMPRGSGKLKLSKMSMGGMGGKMIRGLMKKKNVDSLEALIQSALDNGVRIVACQMSMDLMGIQKEELIDGVELGGVATFLGAAETSDMNLFI